MVHLHDLPILGFDGDRKIGFGLWKWGATAFVVELLLLIASVVFFVSPSSLLLILTIGILFHIINANSFFGFSRRNPFGSSGVYAMTLGSQTSLADLHPSSETRRDSLRSYDPSLLPRKPPTKSMAKEVVVTRRVVFTRVSSIFDLAGTSKLSRSEAFKQLDELREEN